MRRSDEDVPNDFYSEFHARRSIKASGVLRAARSIAFDVALVCGGILLGMLLSSCAVVNGSAYRVQPCPARSDTTATADSLRRHIGCFDTTDSTRKER